MNGEAYIVAFAILNVVTAITLVALGFRCMHRTKNESELRPILLGIVAATGFVFMQMDYIMSIISGSDRGFFREVVYQLVILMTHTAIAMFMMRFVFKPVVDCNCKDKKDD